MANSVIPIPEQPSRLTSGGWRIDLLRLQIRANLHYPHTPLQVETRRFPARAVRKDQRNNRGNVWRAKGELGKAVADYDRALKLDPRYAVAYLNRGVALLLLGHRTEAERDFARALQLDGKLEPTLEKQLRLAGSSAGEGERWRKRGA